MSQSLPVLTGSGSLLGIAESAQSALVSGVKEVSATGGFGTVMSQTAVQQQVDPSREYDAGGEALPSWGGELPVGAAKGDDLDRLSVSPVAVDGAGSLKVAAREAEGLVPPSQTVEQIERFLAIELNVEQSRSEFSRPEVEKSFAPFDVASQIHISSDGFVSQVNSGVERDVSASVSSEVGEYRVAPVSGLEAGTSAEPVIQGEVKAGSVLTEHSPERLLQRVQVESQSSASGVNQLPLPSDTTGLESVVVSQDSRKTSSANEPNIPVSGQPQASDSLVRFESVYGAQQGGLLQQADSSSSAESVASKGSEKGVDVFTGAVFSDSAEQVSAAISSEGEVAVAPVSIAAVSAVDTVQASGRQKQLAEQSFGRDGGRGGVPSGAMPVEVTGTVVNAPQDERSESFADRLARLQSASVSQAEQNQLQKSASLASVDKLMQDKGAVEYKNESTLEALAASIATNKAAKPQSDVLQLQMPNGVKPGMQAWSKAVNERIVLLSTQNGRVAEIQLDPPELGSLQVKLQVKNEQVSVVFSTPHGAVRDALEQGMPRLREMFAEQGMSLTDSSVEDQAAGHNREGSGERQGDSPGYSDFDEDGESTVMAAPQGEGLSLVDYYA